MEPVLAIDIGGTKLAAALVSPEGSVLRVERTPTDQTLSGEELFEVLVALAADVARGERVGGIGIGCGGPMRWPEGVITPLPTPAWQEFPLRARLAERWPGVPVRLHNDAVAVAIAEHWLGAGRGHDHMVGMVVSTGVGGGLVLDGRLVDGRTGNAGHIGHVVVEPDGPACLCGGRGCLEAVAKGPAVVAWALERGWRADGDGPRTGRELAADAAAGEPTATAALARAGHALGLGIAGATALLDVDLVALGGGLSQSGPALWEPLQESFARHARLGFLRDARVVPAALGQEAGLVGAAALVLQGHRYWTAD